ncbi:MAG: hypothetical protein WD533_06420 [Dehalococcoidia bacterium]
MAKACSCSQSLHCGPFLERMANVISEARDGLRKRPIGYPDGDGCLCDARQLCGPVAWGVLHQWAEAIESEICPVCGEEAKRLAVFMHDLVNAKLGKPLYDADNFRDICGMVHEAEAAQGAPPGSVLAVIEDQLATMGQLSPAAELPRRLRRLRELEAALAPDGIEIVPLAAIEPVPDPWGSRCRDPETGQWLPSDICPDAPDDPFTPEGSELTWAIGPNRMQRYEFLYRIVEAEDLIPSHDSFTFTPNPGFPQELQPRLRERAAPRVQVERIAADLDTRLLLEEFRSLDRGAPIIGPDMVVESGNGRVMAIIRAATDFPDSYARYREALAEIAPSYGGSSRDVEDMETPVLVRERITEVVRTDFVEEANATSSISRSTVEIARTNADNITVDMLDSLVVLDGESIEDALRASRNRPFVTRFLATLSPEEQAAQVDASGAINQDGIRRAGTAIFVRTFGTADAGFALAERWFETTEPDVRNVFNGISRSLGPLARAEALVAADERDAGLSIAQDLAEVVTVYSKIKRLGMRVDDYLAQMPLFERELDEFQERMLVAIEDRRRSAKRIGEMFAHYAGQVIASPPPAQGALIPGEAPTKEELWEEAMRRTVRETAPPQPELMPVGQCLPHRRGLRLAQMAQVSPLSQLSGSILTGLGFGLGAGLARNVRHTPPDDEIAASQPNVLRDLLDSAVVHADAAARDLEVAEGFAGPCDSTVTVAAVREQMERAASSVILVRDLCA